MTTDAPVYTPILSPAIRAVIDAGHAVERIVERAAGVRTGKLQVLEAIAAAPGTTAAAVAAQCGLERQTVSVIISNAGDLIKRMPDPDDGRLQRLYLSRNGEALLAHIAVRFAKTAFSLEMEIDHELAGFDCVSLAASLREFKP